MGMIVENYKDVLNKITQAPQQFGLNNVNAKPTLIVVTKTQPIEKIIPLLEIGHRDFGENKVQEAAEKWPEQKIESQLFEMLSSDEWKTMIKTTFFLLPKP